jgi:hypothetical protein
VNERFCKLNNVIASTENIVATQNVTRINEKRADQPLREAVDRFLSYIKKNIETENYQSNQWDDHVVDKMINSVRVTGREPFLKIEKANKVCGYIVKADGKDVKRGDILGRTAFLGRPATSRILGHVLENKFALAA